MVSFDGDPIFNEQNLDQFILASVTYSLLNKLFRPR